MGLAHSPSVVTDGLVLYLDAGNTKSYTGSGTTWTNLSASTNNGTLINGVGFSASNGGSMVFDGSNDYISLESPSDNWAWTPSGVGFNTMTIEMWVKSSESEGYFVSKPWNGNGEYNYLIVNGAFGNGFTDGTNQWHWSNFSSPLASGKWEHICCILTPTQKAVYRNGVIEVGFTNHGVTRNTTTYGNYQYPLSLMTLFPYSTGSWNIPSFSIAGSVSIFKIYNRVLSATEVAQNYAATRGRFGL